MIFLNLLLVLTFSLLMTTHVPIYLSFLAVTEDEGMMVKDVKTEHREKREAEAIPVFSVAQVTVIVRVRNARRDSHEMEKISNNGKMRMLARKRRGNW